MKAVVNNEMNYQAQLVSLPDFWTINSSFKDSSIFVPWNVGGKFICASWNLGANDSEPDLRSMIFSQPWCQPIPCRFSLDFEDGSGALDATELQKAGFITTCKLG